MCFSPKMSVPKTSANIPAPEPIPLEQVKGVEFGGSTDETTKNIAKVAKTTTDMPSAFTTASTTTGAKGTRSARNIRDSINRVRS
jgi:hypothetical protein